MIRPSPSGIFRRYALPYCLALLGAALNIALGILNHAVGLPLYFDSVFTILVTAMFRLGPGLLTALATNVALAVGNEVLLPFALCNASTALIVAVMRRRNGLSTLARYLWLGLWTGLANAILGSIISAFVFGGISTVHRIDDLVSGFVIAGRSLVGSVFLAGALTNLVDKELAALIAFALSRVADPIVERLRTQLTSPSFRA